MSAALTEPTRSATVFLRACDALEADPHGIEDVAPYVLTDGTRTSTALTGAEAYLDGARYVLRLASLHQSLGGHVMYALTTGRKHRVRDNYDEIFVAIRRALPLVRSVAMEEGLRISFYGDYTTSPSAEAARFADEARRVEADTAAHPGLRLVILVDYAADFAARDAAWRDLPQANVILKHTKGQINDGLWLPEKLRENSFVYAQNGSMSSNWSDHDLAYLLATLCRSHQNHAGLQYGKSYVRTGERDAIRRAREEELSFVHRALRDPWSKRVVLFSGVGPEVYEF
jgi:hypothetical protein